MAGIVERIEREAATLRTMLDAALGDWGARAVTLDGPPAIAAFWKAIGWSPRLHAWLEPPETDHARDRAAQLLAEYAEEDPAFRVTLDDLPARFRLVEVDSQGLGFVVTDETSGAEDPPLLAVLAETGKIAREKGTYRASRTSSCLPTKPRSEDSASYR